MLDLSAVFAEFPVRETARLRLRAPTEADAPALFQIMSDPLVLRYFGSLPMTAPEQALARARGFGEAFAERSGIRWAITARATGAYIGSCGFWRIIPEHDRAEIGYELAPAWWGRGIMPEALAPVLEFGFSAMGLHSVEAQIHPANSGSRRVLEKLGFVQEGYFLENYYDVVERGYTDTAVFSLLASSWRAL